MNEQTKPDRRGTFWDWPVALMVVAVVGFFAGAATGKVGLASLALPVFLFALITWLARRGTFSARRR